MDQGNRRAMLAERGKFEGMFNVVRFNWPFFVFGIFFAVFIMLCGWYLPVSRWLIGSVLLMVLGGMVLSLLASHWVYDRSDLYRFNWLRLKETPQSILTVNAGFDETSALIQQKFPGTTVVIADIFDEKIHSEPSIRRAQSRYPKSKGTIHVDASQLPFDAQQFDVVFALMALHEIRDRSARISALRELKRILQTSGSLIVVEHLRDLPNFIVYSFGFFHFLSRPTWHDDFHSANLIVKEEITITPFVRSFILTHGNPS